MDLQAHAVPQRVRERLAQAVPGQDVARQPVQIGRAHAGFHGAHRGLLGLQHGAVHAGHLGVRRAHRDGPGHVAVVPAQLRAHVHRHEVAVLNDAVTGRAVRHRSARAAGDDQVEGTLRARAAQPQLDLGGDVQFARARHDQGTHLGEHLIGQRLGVTDGLHLRAGLHGPQALHQPPYRHQRRLRPVLAQVFKCGDRQVIGLEAHPQPRQTRRGVLQRGGGPRDERVERGLLGGLHRVARVGVQRGGALRDEHLAVLAAAEPAHGADVGGIADPRGVQSRAAQRAAQLLKLSHDRQSNTAPAARS